MPISRFLARTALTTAGVQRAIDELEDEALTNETNGELRLPVDAILTLDEPILQPRVNVDGYGGVSIIGKGKRSTHIRGSDAFPAGRALIERKPRVGGSLVAGQWRSWFQRISNLTMRIPHEVGCRAIHMGVENSADTTSEKWTGEVSNLFIEAHNDFHEEAIYIEGNVHASKFHDIWCDPTLGDGTYDTVMLRSSDGEDNSVDSGGFYNSTIDRLLTTPISGGFCALFRGKLCGGSGRAWQIGYGTASTPCIYLVNSSGFHLVGLQFEGHTAKPQLRMDSCRFVTVQNFTMGFPSRPVVPPYPVIAELGNGIEMRDCSGCVVKGSPRWTGNPSWSHLNFPTLPAEAKWAATLDADCIDNELHIGIGNIDTLATAVQDLGNHNRIRTLNPYEFAPNRVEETYDGDVVIP